MFARSASFRLKSLAMSSDYTRVMESDVIPLLRQQNGFVGELALANPNSMERIAISLWESQAHADHYEVKIYPEVVRMLAPFLAARPVVDTFQTVTTNFGRDFS